MNSCGGTKNTGLGVGFGEQTLTYFLTCRNKWLLEIVYEDVLLRCPAKPDGLQCEVGGRAGRHGTTYATKLVSPVKGAIDFTYLT